MIYKNKYIQIVFIIVIVIVIVIGWFVYKDLNVNVNTEDSISQSDKVITKDGFGLVLSEGDIGDVEVKQISVDNTIDDKTKQELVYPRLGRTLVFSDYFPQDARNIIKNNIATLEEQLMVDSTSFNNWLNLATQYKIIEDYEGAREIWEFLNILFPDNNVSFNNLGDLYHYYLKNFPKSEKNFRKAIENDKKNTQSYIGLYELYKYSYKQDTTSAVDILLEGISKNPENTDLLITLAAYYKEVGNTINAKKFYIQARDKASNLKNTQLVELLNAEISNL